MYVVVVVDKYDVSSTESINTHLPSADSVISDRMTVSSVAALCNSSRKTIGTKIINRANLERQGTTYVPSRMLMFFEFLSMYGGLRNTTCT